MIYAALIVGLLIGYLVGRQYRPGTLAVVQEAPVEPPPVTPARYKYDPDSHKLIRRCVIIGLLLTATVSSQAGNIAVMDPFTKGPKNLVPGTGIAFTGTTISATGVPAGGVTADVFNPYTSAGGGRATNDRVDTVQEQVTAQAVGSALGATAVQPEDQAIIDAAQDDALAAKEPADATIIKESELSSSTTSDSTTTAANSAAVKAVADGLAVKANTSSLGSAAYEDVTSFATAAEGDLAGTALQPTIASLGYANVKNFGAKGDGVVITGNGSSTGCTISSGTADLTCIGASFTAEDIGKYAAIEGAGLGGSGNDLVTTIAAYTSPTEVVLNNPASASVSFTTCEYGTDDTAAISTAADSLQPVGGTLYVPGGIYFVSQYLLRRNSVTDGAGVGSTVLRLKGGSDDNLVELYSSAHSNVFLRNMSVVGNKGFNATGNAVWVQGPLSSEFSQPLSSPQYIVFNDLYIGQAADDAFTFESGSGRMSPYHGIQMARVDIGSSDRGINVPNGSLCDSVFQDVQIHSNSEAAIYFASSCNNHLTNVKTWWNNSGNVDLAGIVTLDDRGSHWNAVQAEDTYFGYGFYMEGGSSQKLNIMADSNSQNTPTYQVYLKDTDHATVTGDSRSFNFTGGTGIKLENVTYSNISWNSTDMSVATHELAGVNTSTRLVVNGSVVMGEAQGTIGGSTGTQDNAVLLADGTGGSTIKASTTLISSSGDMTLNGSQTVVAGTLNDGEKAYTLTATHPSTPTSTSIAESITITTAGNANFRQYGKNYTLAAGYTGSYGTAGYQVSNSVSATGTDPHHSTQFGNMGLRAYAQGATTGTNTALYSYASGGNLNIGFLSRAADLKNSATNVGILGYGRNTGTSAIQVGGYFTNLSASQGVIPSFESAALIADNADQTSPIFIARDNGTAVFTVADGGAITATGNLQAKQFSDTTYAPAAGTSFTVNLDNGMVQELTTNGNTTINLPAPVGGKSYIVRVKYGGAHTVTFAAATGTISYSGGAAPTATSVLNTCDDWVIDSNAAGTYIFIKDGGRNFVCGS